MWTLLSAIFISSEICVFVFPSLNFSNTSFSCSVKESLSVVESIIVFAFSFDSVSILEPISSVIMSEKRVLFLVLMVLSILARPNSVFSESFPFLKLLSLFNMNLRGSFSFIDSLIPSKKFKNKSWIQSSTECVLFAISLPSFSILLLKISNKSAVKCSLALLSE